MHVGAIFTLKFKDRDDGIAHPHLVVVPIGTDRCLVVPCYTPDQPAVTAVIASARRRLMYDHQIFVIINHATCVAPASRHYTFHDSCYIFERADIVDAAIVENGQFRGTMSPDQVKRVAQGVLDMNLAHGGTRLTPKVEKLLRKLVKS